MCVCVFVCVCRSHFGSSLEPARLPLRECRGKAAPWLAVGPCPSRLLGGSGGSGKGQKLVPVTCAMVFRRAWASSRVLDGSGGVTRLRRSRATFIGRVLLRTP